MTAPAAGVRRIRRAPYPTESADEVAHWPITAAGDGCGDGVPRGQLSPAQVACDQCRFWRTNPGGGLDPQDRRDERREWWDIADHCLHHAPRPSSTPGCRGFWRATSGRDRCAEGEPA